MLVAVAISGACQNGDARPRASTGIAPQIQTGRADAAEGAISISTSDWTYSVPLDGLMWIDQVGTRHDAGRPDCLPPGVSRQVRFAAIETTVEGLTWRPVVWVSCK